MKNLKVKITLLVSLVLIIFNFFGTKENRIFSKYRFISFYGFQNYDNIFLRENIPDKEKLSLLNTTKIAIEKNRLFWGSIKSQPKFIYFNKISDFEDFSLNQLVPAYMLEKFTKIIIVTPDFNGDVDLIAHEMCHAEFSKRIGLPIVNVPKWFNEGLAMQMNNRESYLDSISHNKLETEKKINYYCENIDKLQFLDFTISESNRKLNNQNYLYFESYS